MSQTGAVAQLEVIVLTSEEQKLLNDIEFDMRSDHNYEAALKSGEAACKLMHSLTARYAIPRVRLAYFEDPKFHTGRVRCSRKEMFERHGRTGDEIFRDSNFVQYLHYFLRGPDLPSAIITAFRKKVADCYRVTSSDYPSFWAFVREVVRSHGLDRRDAAEEFSNSHLSVASMSGLLIRSVMRP